MKANNRSLLQYLSPTFLAGSPSWVPLIDVYFITPDGTSGVTTVGGIGLEPTFSTITLLQRIRLGGYPPIYYPRFQRTIILLFYLISIQNINVNQFLIFFYFLFHWLSNKYQIVNYFHLFV